MHINPVKVSFNGFAILFKIISAHCGYALNFIEKDKRDQELKIMTNDTLDYKMTQIVSISLHSSALILITTCNCYFRRTLDQ